MLPSYSAKFAVAALTSEPVHHVASQTDLEFHMQQKRARAAEEAARRGAWYLRLVPQPLRQKLQARLETHKLEKFLIELWETSPHLLKDAGYVLSQDADLPPHLVAAPKAVIDYVAAVAPWQIAEAEETYPARRKIVLETEVAQSGIGRLQRVAVGARG